MLIDFNWKRGGGGVWDMHHLLAIFWGHAFWFIFSRGPGLDLYAFNLRG